MKYVVFFIIVFSLFASCAETRLISIDIRKDAPVMFAPDTKKIIIVDNSFITNETESVFEINNRSFITKDVVDSVRHTLLSSLAKYMNEERVFDTVEVYPYSPKPLYLYKETTQKSELPLTRDEVIDICTQTESDALISLDFIRVSFGLKDYYTFLTKVEAAVRAYSHDGTPQSKTVKLEKLISSYINLNDEMNRIRPQLMDNSQWIADMLIDSLIPKWEQQERIYYNAYPEPSPLAINFMEKNYWASATLLWEEVFEKEKRKDRKSKWASNVALSYEYTDDIESALKWVNIAYALLPPNDNSNLAKQIRDYRVILIRREHEISSLKKQLEIKEEVSVINEDGAE
ncbi:MAG: DUF6340 family protein [Dysgonomonas sp.]